MTERRQSHHMSVSALRKLFTAKSPVPYLLLSKIFINLMYYWGQKYLPLTAGSWDESYLILH